MDFRVTKGFAHLASRVPVLALCSFPYPVRGTKPLVTGGCLLLVVGAVPVSVYAQTASMRRQEQYQRAAQAARQRARQREQPDIRLQRHFSTDFRNHALPPETPCFKLVSIDLAGSRLQTFSWVSDYLHGYVGQCVGQRGLNLVVKRATDLILHRGYVTTRLLIPRQDLSSGKLKLLLMPGVVGHIRYAPGSVHAYWRNALPVRPGDLLNLRAIEQGLEQMKRLPSQDVHINITPGDKPGVSDLALDVRRGSCCRVYVSYNDAGPESTGRQQGGVHLAVDQPLGINDLLDVGLSGYVGPQSGKGSEGDDVRYSVPWDNWTFALSSYGYRYHEHIQGVAQAFETGGRSRTTALSVKRVIHRTAASVTAVAFTLSGRNAHSTIEEVEIQVQRRHTRAAELALSQRRYIGRAELDLRLAQRRGVPWFGGQTDPPGYPRGAPTFQYTINTLDAQLGLPFRWGKQHLLWSSTLHAQTTHDRLYAEDFIAIGGRYTVRGFDGEQTLGAERGWFWRNSLGLALGKGVRVYGGVDTGAVSGPSAPTGGGHSLAGAFVGLRGTEYGLRWNVFAGWALHAPTGFATRRPAVGMQVMYQF